jgi:hypothetical protein
MQIKSAKDLIVYQKPSALAMETFEASRISGGREVFPSGSNSAFLEVCLYKYSRGLGETEI